MSDPVRWKDADDAPKGLGELLALGGAIPPMPASVREAVSAEIARAVAPSDLPPKLGPEATSATKGLGSIAALGAGVAVAIAIVVALVSGPRAVESAPPVAPSSPLAVEPAPSVEPPPTISVAPSASVVPAVSAPPSPRIVGSRLAAPAGDTLAEESALVARARAAIATNPAATLTAVTEHARRFPHGELAPERDYLQISALRRLHREEEAKSRGRAYLKAYPSSPYVPAVRDILSELGASP